ncbi:hypothetical protein OAE08_05595 [Gammaproteobacteria bacterium]|nr:hypothetical protein [Gammaproteobacteria bacterium]
MELINTGGRPIKELTEIDAIQVEALAAVCTKSQMAAYFGMTEKTFRAVEERQPEVSTAYRTGRAKAIASIGSVLYEKALSGDIRAVQFYLKTQGGWTEKSYIELSKAEEPIDTHWTVNVVDTSICRNCDQVRSDEN